MAEHAYYRNSPANDSSKFSIENPHVVALWLLHLEELVNCVSAKPAKDSVAGLARFFIAHFPAVTNKLLPAGTGSEEADKLIESEEYFNKLTFDDIASASVNILLLLSRLFVQNEERKDEENRPERYSKLLGLHVLPFDGDAWKEYVADFNKCTDKVIAAQSKTKARLDAGKLSKDKTNLLQFIPNVDQLEKVISFLLPDRLTQPQINSLTPEELVSHLAKVKIDGALRSFRPDMISAEASRNSVCVGKALAKFYANQYKMHEDIVTKLHDFRTQRQRLLMLPTPRPSVVFRQILDADVVLPGRVSDRYRQVLSTDFVWSDYVMETGVSEAEVKQARYEICALVIAGLVKLSGCRVEVLRFAADDAGVTQRLATLQLLDPSVELQEFSTVVPKEIGVVSAPWAGDQAEKLATLLKRMRDEEVPETDFQTCPDMFGVASLASQAVIDTAATENSASVPEPRGKKRKTDASSELNADSIQTFVGPVSQLLKACFMAARTEIPAHEVGKKFGGTIEEDQRQGSANITFKLLESLGLGRLTLRGGTLTLQRPSQEGHTKDAAQRLAELLKLDAVKLQKRLLGRTPNETFQPEAFQEWFQVMQPIIQAHNEANSEVSEPGDASLSAAAPAPDPHASASAEDLFED